MWNLYVPEVHIGYLCTFDGSTLRGSLSQQHREVSRRATSATEGSQRFPSHGDSNRACQELPTQRTRGYRVGKLRSQVFKSARWQLVPGDRSADAVDLVQRPTTCIQSINGSSGQTGEGDEATYSQGGLRVGRAGRWLRARIPASSWDRRISTRMLPR